MVVDTSMEDAVMHTFKRFCREHGITHKRVFWLGLFIFGDDLLVISILAVLHYLHLGGAGM
jgi:hypothetical protein